MSIPNILHLTWKNKKIPKDWSHVIDSWKKTNPQLEIHFTTDRDNRNYIKEKHPDFLHIYDSYPYNIQRADAIRYFYLRDMGGIYADMDIEPLKNIEEYFKNVQADAILVYSGNVNSFTNSLMASQKDNYKFWDKVIERLKNPIVPFYALGKHFIVMYTTGCIMLDQVARDYDGVIAVLPRSVFMAYSIADHHLAKPKAALKPLKGGTWNEFDSLFYNFCFKHKYKIISVILILIFYNKNKKTFS